MEILLTQEAHQQIPDTILNHPLFGEEGSRTQKTEKRKREEKHQDFLFLSFFFKGLFPKKEPSPFCLWDGKCYSAARPLANCGFLFLFPITLSHA
jgi:hypothetical protein